MRQRSVLAILVCAVLGLWLMGEGAPAAVPAGVYRVTGKVGEMPVDLLVTPLGGAAVPAASAGAIAAGTTVSAEAPAAALVQPSRGQLPNDTGTVETKLSLEERPELGGKALKVVFAGSDSFGQTVVKVKDWRPFLTIQFDVFNPGPEKVRLALNIKHKRSTSYQTRIEVPCPIPPGKSSIKLSLDEMSNVNGSAPDFSLVTHWYVICQADKSPPLYFGDFSSWQQMYQCETADRSVAEPLTFDISSRLSVIELLPGGAGNGTSMRVW